MTTSVRKGDTLQFLTCSVDAFPAPVISVWRDKERKVSVGNSDRISIVVKDDPQNPATFSLAMTITGVVEEDGGTYYCAANNTLGEDSAIMGLNVTDMPVSNLI